MRFLFQAAFLVAPLWVGSMGLARAASPPVMTWETSVDGGCRVRPAQLAREVDLACDSVGRTCRRVEHGATARALLACNDASAWTVEARDANGAHLWTLAIDGARESRVRVAAMWIARAQRDAPPPDAPVIVAAPTVPSVPAAPATSVKLETAKREVAKAETAAPETTKREIAKSEPAKSDSAKRDSAKEIAKNEPAAPAKSDTTAASAASGARDASTTTAPDSGTNDAPSAHGRGGIAALFGFALSSGVASQASSAGAHVAFALPLGLNAGLSIDASRTLGGTTGYTLTTGRAGAILGWGAPWNAGILGASIEAGALAGSVGAQSSASPNARTFGVPYAELALIAALPTHRALRPWIALSLMGLARPIRVTESGQASFASTQAMGGIDVGLAWAAW